MERRPSFQDSSLASVLRTAWDLMVLNFLWMLCSIPVITLGPATCALYTVTMKLAGDEPVAVVGDFFRAFADNFGRGLILGLACMALAVVAGVDAWFALQQSGLLRVVFLTVALIVGVVFLTAACYGFALQARFCNTLGKHLANGFALTLCQPGRTLLLWVIFLLPIAAALAFPEIFIQALGFLYPMLGASLPALLISKTCLKIFSRVELAQRPEADQ